MRFFALNLGLAIIWMLLHAHFSLRGLLVGFGMGLLVLTLAEPALGSRRYVYAIGGTFRLLFYFIYALTSANLRVARDILRRRPPFEPGYLDFDVSDLSPFQVVLLANLVSLTPGTIIADLDQPGRRLVIHTLYAWDAETVLGDVRRFARLVRATAGDLDEDMRP